jgi:copper chaperone NosL
MRTFILIAFIGLTFSSCGTTNFEPIDFGKEACAHCKMTILDRRYFAEMITKKGRVYKFDDVLCMKKFIDDNNMSSHIGKLFVANYKDGKNGILDVNEAVFLHNTYFHSPMNGCCAAFQNIAQAQSLKDSLHAEIINWNKVN